jgi:hypothetical protein
VWAGSIFQVLTAIASGQVVDDAMIRRWAPSIAQAAGGVPTEEACRPLSRFDPAETAAILHVTC